MHNDLFDHKAHALEALLVGAILPHSIVVDFVHAIYKAYL